MKNGFIKAVAASVEVSVANTAYNCEKIKEQITRADGIGANLLVLPELCVTGYSCGDLFFSEALIKGTVKALEDIRDFTKGLYPVVICGAPVKSIGKIYNCAVVIHDGKILGIIPKTHLPNYAEYAEKRQFASSKNTSGKHSVKIGGCDIPFSTKLIFECIELDSFRIGVEICEDIWVADPPSRKHCQSGATVIANTSASNELIGKEDSRRSLLKSSSTRLICGYVYANSAYTESTQDVVFSAHNMICETGVILSESTPFAADSFTVSEIDTDKIEGERCRFDEFMLVEDEKYEYIPFSQPLRETEFTHTIDRNPFVPSSEELMNERAEGVLNVQSYGLKKRMEHTKASRAVIGVSGGLDSCLALLVAARTMDLMNRPRTDILAVTMPCFGTSSRTKTNAQRLCEELGVELRSIDITEAVRLHFRDIGHDENVYDAVYENSQARERTQVLMDIANKENGLVIGTGDLSELALGWATYNGDHMSMYAVNSSLPKTLVRAIVIDQAKKAASPLAEILTDIVDTPVSPELLPSSSDGEISQKTEDSIGPYELHDFFIYYAVRYGFSPAKIFRLAKNSFKNLYSDGTILKYLRLFVRRFFTQQFKRSCMPDGPKAGEVSLSPRGDWKMPSDASSGIWLAELDEIEKSL